MEKELTRGEWLDARKTHIGGSDVAQILGQSPYGGPLSVYNAKVLGESQSDSDWLKFGRSVEGAIADMYATKTGRKVEDCGATSFCYHPEYDWLAATLDRIVHSRHEAVEPAPLELKHVSTFEKPADWAESPPLHYQIQLQTQIACYGSDWGSLAGMFPGYQLAYKDIDRDDGFLNAAMPVLKEFWQRVSEKDPPAPTSEKDLPAVKRLWEHETGEEIILDETVMGKVDLWSNLKKEIREADKKAKAIEAELRAAMKTATFGKMPNGKILTLKETHRKAYVKDVAAGSFRTLRIKG